MGLVDSDQLLSPKRAHVALREREGALNPGNLCCAGFVCVFVFEWGQVKGIVDYVDINVYALEIPWGEGCTKCGSIHLYSLRHAPAGCGHALLGPQLAGNAGRVCELC